MVNLCVCTRIVFFIFTHICFLFCCHIAILRNKCGSIRTQTGRREKIEYAHDRNCCLFSHILLNPNAESCVNCHGDNNPMTLIIKSLQEKCDTHTIAWKRRWAIPSSHLNSINNKQQSHHHKATGLGVQFVAFRAEFFFSFCYVVRDLVRKLLLTKCCFVY